MYEDDGMGGQTEVIRTPRESVIETAMPHEVHHHKHHHKHESEVEEKEMATEIIDAGGGMGGAGAGLGAGLGGGLLGGILAGALFGGGGLNGRGGEGVVTPSQLTAALAGVQDTQMNTAVLQTLGAIQGSIPLAEGQVQLALAGVNQSLQAQGFAGQLANLQGFTNTGDKVDSLSTLTAVGFGQVNTAIERNGWAVTTNANENTNRILQALNEQNIQNLQRQLTVAESALLFERSEAGRASDRHGVEITMTNNQNQNQMQFQQQAQVLNGLAHLLSDVSQIARATNTNLIVGNTGATTTGPQTANPVNVKA